ncbi:MAG: hypothetical protein Q9167_007726, partial [Letrouitia subvulpina]
PPIVHPQIHKNPPLSLHPLPLLPLQASRNGPRNIRTMDQMHDLLALDILFRLRDTRDPGARIARTAPESSEIEDASLARFLLARGRAIVAEIQKLLLRYGSLAGFINGRVLIHPSLLAAGPGACAAQLYPVHSFLRCLRFRS